MISIDEAIANAREVAEEIRENIIDGDNLEPYESYCNAMVDKSAEEHEHLAEWLEELKTIKEMDLSIPQHFTKEQSGWIKAYCIKRNIEFYNKALDDLLGGMNQITYNYQNADELFEKICDLAEQLKAG